MSNQGAVRQTPGDVEGPIERLHRENAELRRRLEILERYAAMSLSSSGATWSAEAGLDITHVPKTKIAAMIMGHTKWDPDSLDEGG